MMKPKYTTVALREKIIEELYKVMPQEKSTYASKWERKENVEKVADKLVVPFTAAQSALLDEVEKRLPEKVQERQVRGRRWDDGYNQAIDKVTETLEQLRKEIV